MGERAPRARRNRLDSTRLDSTRLGAARVCALPSVRLFLARYRLLGRFILFYILNIGPLVVGGVMLSGAVFLDEECARARNSFPVDPFDRFESSQDLFALLLRRSCAAHVTPKRHGSGDFERIPGPQ